MIDSKHLQIIKLEVKVKVRGNDLEKDRVVDLMIVIQVGIDRVVDIRLVAEVMIMAEDVIHRAVMELMVILLVRMGMMVTITEDQESILMIVTRRDQAIVHRMMKVVDFL